MNIFAQQSRFRKICVSVVFLLSSSQAFAWGEHNLASRPALEAFSPIGQAQPVRAETLESFLVKEETQIAELLKKEEARLAGILFHYDPVPNGMAFRATGRKVDIVRRFLRAVRIRPDARAALYLQLLPGESQPRPRAKLGDISTLKGDTYYKTTVFVKVKAGDKVRPLLVVSTASDEPDLGFDIGLFTDNKTDFGRAYGFGVQPFGNPNLDYSSQAPFHMGFYHESWIVYAAGSFLRRTHPEYRILMFAALSELAFRTGHDYWGYRFMGWGLHYVQDLTQPYHATPLPGIGTFGMLWINILAILGSDEKKKAAIQLVSNRHMAIESYQRNALRGTSSAKVALHKSLTNLSRDELHPAFGDGYVRNILTEESMGAAAKTDSIIARAS